MSTRTIIFVLIAAATLATVGAGAQTPAELIPHGRFVGPQILVVQNEPRLVPTTVTLTFDGTDPDAVDHQPAMFRILLNRALISEAAGYATSRVDVMENLDVFASFADSAWTGWMPWPADPGDRRITYVDLATQDALGRSINYVAALQLMDTDGAVSLDRRYGINLFHFRVGDVDPVLAAYEPVLGDFQAMGPGVVVPLDVGADTYDFQWAASAEPYGSEIVAYRWGLDLTDPDDPNDPGWAGPPGLDPANLTTGPFDLNGGVHSLTIQAEDAAGGFTRLVVLLDIIPIIDPANQLPLLMVDDVYDQNSNGWPGEDGTPLDRDTYRDLFWDAVLGGVVGFDPARDVVDCENDALGLRDAVQYRAIAWNTRWTNQPYNFVAREFRPISVTDEPYVWLAQYQMRAGNLLLTGQRVTDSFHAAAQYALPVVFESSAGNPYDGVQDGYRVGFGEIRLPDGSTTPRGPTRYGYRTLGLSVIDQMAPASSYVLWDTGEDPPPLARQARKAPCAALKSLVLDPDFVAQHMPGGPAFPDTIATDSMIDWQDVVTPGYHDDLANPYIWGNDEFYEDPGLRDDPFTYQTCDGAPGGLCVEPMFRSQARFDWIRQQHLEADPGDDWPEGYYTESELDQLCGAYLLDDTYTSAQATTDEIVGFLTYKPTQDRPNLVADVVWGFDPYRFDHAGMAEAIGWVLGEHFGLVVNP